MGKLNKNNRGFGAVELIMATVIVILLCVVGLYVYKDHHKATTTKIVTVTKTTPAKSTTNIAINPYSGWKTATLKYEQISYQYPSNWTLTGSSTANGSSMTPGVDSWTLTSPSGDSLTMDTGYNGAGVATLIDSNPITVLGNNYYISGIGPGPDATEVSRECIEANQAQDSVYSYIPDKNITSSIGQGDLSQSDVASDMFCYNPANPASANTVESVSDFSTGKLIFESMKYSS